MSCFIKIQISSIFWVTAYQVVLEKEAIKWVFVCLLGLPCFEVGCKERHLACIRVLLQLSFCRT